MNCAPPAQERNARDTDPQATRARLQRMLALAGVCANVQLSYLGPDQTKVAVSSLTLLDAERLVSMLMRAPELRPYLTPEEREEDAPTVSPDHCVHAGVRAGDTCPMCHTPVEAPAPTHPQRQR